MFKLIVLTLISMVLIWFVYDQIQYRLYVKSVNRGVIGQIRKYRTPSTLLQFIRNIGFVCRSFTKLWS